MKGISPEFFFAGVCCGGLVTLPIQVSHFSVGNNAVHVEDGHRFFFKNLICMHLL